MEKMFSNVELKNITGANIILYKDLKHIKNIEPYLPLIVLYEVTDDYGHWTCVFKNKEGINFFDSLGFIPDDELRIFNKGKYRPKLLKLIFETGLPIIYSDKKLQKNDPNINTCGRYCIARLELKNLGAKEFSKLFSDVDHDRYVTELTKRHD